MQTKQTLSLQPSTQVNKLSTPAHPFCRIVSQPGDVWVRQGGNVLWLDSRFHWERIHLWAKLGNTGTGRKATLQLANQATSCLLFSEKVHSFKRKALSPLRLISFPKICKHCWHDLEEVLTARPEGLMDWPVVGWCWSLVRKIGLAASFAVPTRSDLSAVKGLSDPKAAG